MVTSWTPWPRPEWVEAVNATGAHLGDPAAVVSLRRDELEATARSLTGLDDFGGDEFRAPLGLLLDSLERDGDLHLVGRILTRTDILRVLVNRLQIAAEESRQPGIADEPITAPVFVTGTGRSGTSLLHQLLAGDPTHRAPLTWEMRYPLDREPTTPHPRIGAADRDVTLWNLVTPEYTGMHTNGGHRPNECTFMVMHEFLGSYWMGAHDAPDYARWLQRADAAPAYRYHRRFLRLLQHEARPAPARPWVLKDPWHISALPALFAEYPDARVVVTHRDPSEVLPSLVNLMSSLRWQRSDRVDRRRLVKFATVGTAHQLDTMTRWRDDGTVPSDQIVDVRYPDLVSDPVGTVAATYERLGLDLGSDARARMATAVADDQRSVTHDYSFSDLGVDADETRERFAPYRARYGV